MNKTLLKFSSAIYLIAFRKYSKAAYWEINLTDLTVICDCTPKELRAACQDFKAIHLNREEVITAAAFSTIEMPHRTPQLATS